MSWMATISMWTASWWRAEAAPTPTVLWATHELTDAAWATVNTDTDCSQLSGETYN